MSGRKIVARRSNCWIGTTNEYGVQEKLHLISFRWYLWWEFSAAEPNRLIREERKKVWICISHLRGPWSMNFMDCHRQIHSSHIDDGARAIQKFNRWFGQAKHLLLFGIWFIWNCDLNDILCLHSSQLLRNYLHLCVRFDATAVDIHKVMCYVGMNFLKFFSIAKALLRFVAFRWTKLETTLMMNSPNWNRFHSQDETQKKRFPKNFPVLEQVLLSGINFVCRLCGTNCIVL